MNLDFHYYGTYSAARLAGYERAEAEVIAYYAQFVDECAKDFLTTNKVKDGIPTVQSNGEIARMTLDVHKFTKKELKEAAEAWGCFHFLPGNTKGEIAAVNMSDKERPVFKRLCLPCSELAIKTVKNAKLNGTLPGIGMAMHVLADTWAHCNFAGIPAKFINDASGKVCKLDKDNNIISELLFTWDPFADNLTKDHYSCTPPNPLRDQGILYLGHGRMGHLPDYGFLKYSYYPLWKNGEVEIKDNPDYFMKAFCQMIAALQYIRGNKTDFTDRDFAKLGKDTENRIQSIINTVKLDTSNEWKDFIKNYLSVDDETAGGLGDFNNMKCVGEYASASDKKQTNLYKFFEAAKDHKDFVTREVGEYSGY